MNTQKPKATQSQLAGTDTQDRGNTNDKLQSLEPFRSDATGQALRTNQGVKVADNQNSLKAGARGPSLLEDFIMREKITHFDHERIPERIVHARGTAAHGYFQAYQSHAALTKAGFLQDPGTQTPVFVRFSTVQGPRGSGDTVRDIRGFAVKFFTEEGNFDLVGNNVPVFFIQDAIKFPDFVHAVKPEPHNEIPTGGSAHDTFWDFVSLVLRFVKFHWRPTVGTFSLVWDEAQKLAGKDTDFHRRDLWESIESGDYPEWELGVQVIAEEDEHSFDFDILDPTKLIPEELVPIQPLGKMVLNRNPDNFFAETEQVAFCPGHIVPGIDFSNDPLLQGRLFSYTDTQISRLGGPNFHEIPSSQRDAQHRTVIDKGRASYEPNSIDAGWPRETPPAARDGGFESYPERIDAAKIRQRSESFSDHFSQARLFFHSMSPHEQEHIIAAYSFELGKVEREHIRARQVNEILANIDLELAARVAANLGLPAPTAGTVAPRKTALEQSPALSQANLLAGNIKTRKVAILAANGVDGGAIAAIRKVLEAEGAHARLLGPTSAAVTTAKGESLAVDASMEGLPSVAFDAVYVPGGVASVKALGSNGVALHYLLEAYKHLKPIAVHEDAKPLLEKLHLQADAGLLVGSDAKALKAFVAALAEHRVWEREERAKAVPA